MIGARKMPTKSIVPWLAGSVAVIVAGTTLLFGMPDHENTKSGTSGISSQPHRPREVLEETGYVLRDYGPVENLTNLVQSSELIVVAQVLSRELVDTPQEVVVPQDCSAEPGPLNAGKECPETLTFRDGYYISHYTVSLLRELKGGGDAGELVIRAGGGVVEGTELVYLEEPFLEEGARYLLFLNPDPSRAGVYLAKLGSLGVYELEGGQLNGHLLGADYESGAPALLDSMTEDQAVVAIEAEVSAQQEP